MRIFTIICVSIIAIFFPAIVFSQEYIFYQYDNSTNFSIQHIEPYNGSIWLAAGRSGAVNFNPKTGSYSVMTSQDGLFSDDVMKSIKVDSRGVIWFGMGQGLIEYDGVSMTKYEYGTGFIMSEIGDIYEDSAGTMWFADAHGVHTYDGDNWIHYDTEDGLGRPYCKHVMQSPDGSMWVSCNRGVSRFKDGTWTDFSAPFDNNSDFAAELYGLLVAQDGMVWIGTTHGIMRFDGSEWTVFTVDDGLTGTVCRAIAQTNEGVIWAATGVDPWVNNSFSVFDGESWAEYPDNENIVASKIISVHTDDNGNLWFGTENSEIYTITGDTVEVLRIESVVNSPWVHTVTVDNDNTVWIGTDKGAQSISEGKWRSYFQRDGLPEGAVRDLTVTDSGTVWAAADSGAAYFDGVLWNTINEDDMPYGTSTRSVGSAGNDVWFGTTRGLKKYSNGAWTTFSSQEGLPDDSITAVFAGSEIDVWAGTELGIAGFDGESWTTFTTADGLPDNSVSSIIRDQRGILWVGTMGGLASYNGITWTTYRANDGNSALPDDVVVTMALDQNGRIWFGTEKGSAWFNGSEWGVDYKLNNIFDMAVDMDNVMWATGFFRDGKVIEHPLSYEAPPSPVPTGSWKVCSADLFIMEMAVTDQAVWVIDTSDIVRYDKENGIAVSYLQANNTNMNAYNITAKDESYVYAVIKGYESSSTYDILHYNGTQWELVTENVNRYYLYTDPFNEVWYHKGSGHGYGSIYRYNIETNTRMWVIGEFLPHALFFASDNTAWMGWEYPISSQYPLWHDAVMDDNDWVKLNLPESCRGAGSIAQTANGDMLFASLDYEYYGVARYDGVTWTTYNTGDGLLDNRVHDIAVDNTGAWWVSTMNGISYYDGSVWTDITSGNSPILQNNYNNIEVDSDGVVWIGSPSGLISFTYDDVIPISVEKTEPAPSEISLDAVYPNPFNPYTTITYSLKEPGSITLTIYNTSGQRVRELVDGYSEGGKHVVMWDSRNNGGAPVSSGVYFAVLANGQRTSVRRMMLVK